MSKSNALYMDELEKAHDLINELAEMLQYAVNTDWKQYVDHPHVVKAKEILAKVNP